MTETAPSKKNVEFLCFNIISISVLSSKVTKPNYCHFLWPDSLYQLPDQSSHPHQNNWSQSLCPQPTPFVPLKTGIIHISGGMWDLGLSKSSVDECLLFQTLRKLTIDWGGGRKQSGSISFLHPLPPLPLPVRLSPNLLLPSALLEIWHSSRLKPMV